MKNQNFEIVEKKLYKEESLKKNFRYFTRTRDYNKENLPILENKLDYVFKEINLVLDNFTSLV